MCIPPLLENGLCDSDECKVGTFRGIKTVTWIGCDSCSRQYHLACVGATRKDTKKKHWYCAKCSELV